MIKKIFVLLMSVISLFSVAQESTNQESPPLLSKDGEVVLPQAKDWGIGLDATALIKSFEFNFLTSSQAISVKYFRDAKTAYRIGARLGVNSHMNRERVIDRLASTNTVIAFPAAEPTKQNTWARTSTAFGLSFGIEKRRGSTRLQGIYGVEGGIFVTTLTEKFTYGNALNSNPSSPVTVHADDAMSSSAFGSAQNIDTVPLIQGVQGSARVLQRRTMPSVSLGARLFLGAEYFVLPKMSLGGEFGWGFAFTTQGRTETVVESIGQSNISGNTGIEVKRTTLESASSNSFRLDSDRSSILGGLSASLRLNLYF